MIGILVMRLVKCFMLYKFPACRRCPRSCCWVAQIGRILSEMSKDRLETEMVRDDSYEKKTRTRWYVRGCGRGHEVAAFLFFPNSQCTYVIAFDPSQPLFTLFLHSTSTTACSPKPGQPLVTVRTLFTHHWTRLPLHNLEKQSLEWWYNMCIRSELINYSPSMANLPRQSPRYWWSCTWPCRAREIKTLYREEISVVGNLGVVDTGHPDMLNIMRRWKQLAETADN